MAGELMRSVGEHVSAAQAYAAGESDLFDQMLEGRTIVGHVLIALGNLVLAGYGDRDGDGSLLGWQVYHDTMYGTDGESYERKCYLIPDGPDLLERVTGRDAMGNPICDDLWHNLGTLEAALPRTRQGILAGLLELERTAGDPTTL